MKLRLSASKISVFLSCRRKYQWIYKELLIPKTEKSIPLQVGDFTHRLLHTYYTKGGEEFVEYIAKLKDTVAESYPDQDAAVCYKIAFEAANLVKGYINQYHDDPLEVISSETHLMCEYKGINLYTRVDGLARTEDQRLWRLEHKTAGKVDSLYLDGLKKGVQTALAHHIMKKTLTEAPIGTIFNMLVKTKIPQYPRAFALYHSWLDVALLQCIDGMLHALEKEDFYPNLNDCTNYQRECEYLTLCKQDTPERRAAFYQPRVEMEIPNYV